MTTSSFENELHGTPAAFINFRDHEACRTAREIPRERIAIHPNEGFQISIVDDVDDFFDRFASDLVGRIRSARDEGRQFVVILPVGPTAQYIRAAAIINREQLSLSHVHTFNMDEYADSEGKSAPLQWAGSFQRAMWEGFFGLIDEQLRPPDNQIHFPSSENIGSYSDDIAQLGGADACYGGIGWCGHIAFWEPHLGQDYDGLEEYLDAGSRLVELHPMTIMQNALLSFGGDWSWVPPKAVTVGPRDIMGAKHRSFWLDGEVGGGMAWQRFIARLVAHGPISTEVPGSILQLARTDYVLLGGVADNVEVRMV